MKNKQSLTLSNYLKLQRSNSIEKLLHKKHLIITILGYGVTGKSFLRWCKNNLHTTTQYFIIDKKQTGIEISEDQKTIQLSESYKKSCFKKSNFILPSPGFCIQKGDKWYWKIIPELDLFFYLWNKTQQESIIITGSIGKTSLSTMINHYLSKKQNTILCGNIGLPTLDFLKEHPSDNTPNKKLIAVIECSNLQLDHCVLIKTDYFIITNLFNNHLDMHKSYEKYILSKLTPIIFQHSNIKKIIISQTAYNQLKIYYSFLLKTILKNIVLISEMELVKHKKNNIPFIHIKNNMIFKNNAILLSHIPSFSFILNWQILAAILHYYIKDIDTLIKEQPLPSLPDFRLQKTVSTSLITIYNDSKSTIIESSISALTQILAENKDNPYIFFMVGGLSKGVSRTQGISTILNQVHELILFGGEAIELEKNLISKINIEKINSIKTFTNLSQATAYTISRAKLIQKNSIVIFSPGGSSFDEFNSYIDRGNQFNQMIGNLI
jgi:UDP-N-acetylmuramoylalanine--D-glutamate ligase